MRASARDARKVTVVWRAALTDDVELACPSFGVVRRADRRWGGIRGAAAPEPSPYGLQLTAHHPTGALDRCVIHKSSSVDASPYGSARLGRLRRVSRFPPRMDAVVGRAGRDPWGYTIR